MMNTQFYLMDTPLLLPIKKIVTETPNVKTYYFDYPLNSKAGQFVMLWVPGFDQKPFSIGYDDGKMFGLTIFAVGKSTHELSGKKVGGRVGITGPYGTAFSVKPNTHYIMVAGGYGAAPLGFLAEEATNCHKGRKNLCKNVTVDFCVGARNKEHLLFEKRTKKLLGFKFHIATDDGSRGHKGYVTDLIPDLISKAKKEKKKIVLVTCGPELMEKKVLEIANKMKVDCEISIERFMKCGFGVCGACCVDPLGLRMCTEGPVVKKALANKITEFGKYHRDKSGAVIKY